MINIHNIYLDLLYGIYRHLNKTLNNELNGLTTNLGNPTFQLKERSNYQLPWAIINLNDYTTNLRPNQISHPHWDISLQRLGFHSCDKDISVVIQESMFLINIEVKINCDTHLEALNIKHHLLTHFPLDKHIYIEEYTSFIEVPDYIINNNLVDFQNDKVNNIYVMTNQTTGEKTYFFGMNYKPLLKTSSINNDISSNNELSYSVDISLEVQTSIPLYIIFPWINNYTDNLEEFKTEEIKKVGQKFITKSNEISHILYLKNKDDRKTYRFDIKNSDINKTNFEFGKLLATVIDSYTSYNIGFIWNNELITGDVISREKTSGIIRGDDIGGFCYNLKIKKDKLTFFFEGRILNEQVNSEITCNLVNTEQKTIYDGFSIISDDWLFMNVIECDKTNLIKSVSDINHHKAKIKKLTIRKINGEEFLESSDSGVFSNGIEINYKSGLIKHMPDEISEIDYDVVFEMNTLYGAGYINTVNIQFNNTNESLISGGIDVDEDISDSINFIISKPEFMYDSDRRVYLLFIKVFTTEFNIDDIKWILLVPHTSYKISSKNERIKLLKIGSLGDKICLEIPENEFIKNILTVDKFNPMFFYLKK
jgi:hypothetical protein